MSLPGILDLYKTYGEKNKRLYRCVPDDKTLPVHFIPYTLPVTFDKSVRYIYILFRSVDPPHGVLVHTLGRVESMVHTYEYLIHCKIATSIYSAVYKKRHSSTPRYIQ